MQVPHTSKSQVHIPSTCSLHCGQLARNEGLPTALDENELLLTWLLSRGNKEVPEACWALGDLGARVS
jgi:hypothetical protein